MLALVRGQSARNFGSSISIADAIQRAAEHVFERKTVVSTHEFTATVFQQSYGAHSLANVKAAVAAGTGGLLHADGHVSTQSALDLERSLVDKLNAGVGVTDIALGVAKSSDLQRLSAEQRRG